jgi:hypothetical protein
MGITDSLSNDMKKLLDFSAYGAIFAWLIHVLPAIALAFTTLWMGTRLYEYFKQKWLKFYYKRKGIPYKEEQIPG